MKSLPTTLLLAAGVILFASDRADAVPLDGKGKAPRGLAFVPGNAVTFIHLNLSALRDNPTFQLMRKPLAKGLEPLLPDFIERSSGVRLADATGMTQVISASFDPITLVAVNKGYDSDKVRKAALRHYGGRQGEHKHKGKTIYFASFDLDDAPVPRFGGRQPAPPPPPPRIGKWSHGLLFIDQRNFAFGRATALIELIDHLDKQPEKSGLQAAIDHAARTQHHLSVGVHLTPELRREMERDFKRSARRDPILAASLYNLMPVLELKTISLTANLGEETSVNLRAHYASEAVAKRARPSAEFAVSLGGGMLKYLAAQMESELGIRFDVGSKSKMVALWERLDQGLANASIQQEKNELIVAVKAKTELTLVQAGLTELVPPLQRVARRHESSNNLKLLGLAMHNLHDTYGALPLPAWQGQPLQAPKKGAGLSWRVAVLPYLEQNELYKKFKLDEPWDSEHNKRLIREMPKLFAAPGIKTNQPGLTHYRVFTGPMAIFNNLRPASLARIKDGTSNTMMIVEAGEPVIWTRPDELTYDAKKPLPKLGGIFPTGFHALFGDGSVQFFKKDQLTEQHLRAFITAQGGEVVPSRYGPDDAGVSAEGFDPPPRPPINRDVPPDGGAAAPKPPPLPPGDDVTVPDPVRPRKKR